MKTLLFLTLILLNLLSFGQINNKKFKYFYFNNNLISEKEYNQLDKRKIYFKDIENDTAIIKKTYLNKKIEILNQDKFIELKLFLKELIGSNFDDKKKTMIHFYSKENLNFLEDSKLKNYWKWINNNSKKYQSFLIATENLQIKNAEKNHIYVVKNNFLQNLFFENSDYKINHLLLKPSGEIYIYYGIDDILNVLDWSVD